MEDGRRQNRAGMAFGDGFDKMLERARPAGSDDGHGHRVGHGPCQIDVEAGLRAVPIHRREQDFPGTPLHHLAGECDRVDAGGACARRG